MELVFQSGASSRTSVRQFFLSNRTEKYNRYLKIKSMIFNFQFLFMVFVVDLKQEEVLDSLDYVCSCLLAGYDKSSAHFESITLSST